MSIRRIERDSGRALAAVWAMLLLGLAAPSWGSELVAVRVGEHPTYTRVVFELDALAGYRIERDADGEAPGVVRVTLDAASPDRDARSGSSGVASVRVAAGSAHSVARIETRGPARPIKEMILANPPRVVLDFMRPAPVASRRASPPPEPAVAEVAPSAPSAEAEPEPPVAQPAPQERIAAAPTAAPTPEPAPVAELPEAEPVAAPEIEIEAVETATMEPVNTTLGEAPEAPLELAATDAATAGAGDPAETDPIPEAAPARISDGESPAADAGATAGSFGTIAAAAGGIAVLALALIWMRRRRAAPKQDVDVSQLFAEGDEPDDRPIPKDGFSMGATPAVEADDRAGAATAAGAGRTRAADAPRAPEPSSAPGAGPGIFDEALEEKETTTMENTDATIGGVDSEAATQLGAGIDPGAAGGSNIVRIIQDMESRIAHLEARLDESIEARKQLERQVSAQTEELRVQRAAIARTQRALRSMNRSDEEQATEPALRNPDASPRTE